MLRIYLAGAIRNGNQGDLDWRNEAVKALKWNFDVWSPTAGKSYTEGKWSFLGSPPQSKQIVAQDLWMVDNCDVFLANLTSLSEGYPTIGTLIEFGRATAMGKAIYAIVSEKPVAGIEGALAGFQVAIHPFILENSAMTFTTVEDALTYLQQYVYVLNGMAPENGMEEISERMKSDVKLVGELENDDLKIGGTDAD